MEISPAMFILFLNALSVKTYINSLYEQCHKVMRTCAVEMVRTSYKGIMI